MDLSHPKFDLVQLYPHSKGFRLDWYIKGYGFGIILFSTRETGEIDLDHECMSKDFVKAALAALVDKAQEKN